MSRASWMVNKLAPVGGRSVMAVLLAALLSPLAGAASGDGSWTLDTALKQIDSVAGDFKTAVADVEMAALESQDAEPEKTSGKAYFSKDGSFRIDVTAPETRTALGTGGDLYVHDPERGIVEHFALAKHPERLEGYAVLGFSLTGKAMNKDYLVGLLGERVVGDHKALLFELTPKDDAMRASVSHIHLTIDQATWLPLEQKVFWGDGVRNVTVTYQNVSRNLQVDNALFKPKWPKGTQTVKR